MNDRLIQTQRLLQIVDAETFILLTFLGLLTFVFYKLFLREVSEERHQNINGHLKRLFKYYSFLAVCFLCFEIVINLDHTEAGKRLLPYVGVLTFLSGAIYFVKTCRLLVLQYLFLGSMRAGVPMLLVNIFSLVLSILIAFWSISLIFGVHVTPLLATSAAASIILGLALQDTLGNLFAGISLQIDKTFEIGNWLEIINGPNKIVGQVKELTWRSTVLVGFSDEVITLPNKMVAQCQVSNFSPENQPIVRSQIFRFPFGTPTETAISLLEKVASQISEIRPLPSPFAYVQDINDIGYAVKIIYFVDNYGRQFAIGDKLYQRAFELMKNNGIDLARPSINVYDVR